MPDLAAGVGIRLAKEEPNLLRVSTDVVSGRSLFVTWSDLNAHPGTTAGQVAEVPTSDSGTHTDPVVGGTVNNSGIFRWSASPAGWQRIADVDAVSASAFADAAATSAGDAATSAAAAAAAAADLSGVVGVVRPGTSTSGRLIEFIGRLGAIFSYVSTDMVWHVIGLVSRTGYGVGGLGRRIADYFDPLVGLAVTDEDGRVYAEVGLNGLRAQALRTDSINGVATSSISSLLGEAQMEINPDVVRYVAAAYGQSLAGGTGATADPVTDSGAVALTTDQPYGNEMLAGGVRPDDASPGTDDASALVPHVENAFGGISGQGETILGGFQAMLFQLLNAYGMAPIDLPWRTVSLAISQGATPIAGFHTGYAPFTRFMGRLSDIKALASGGHVQMPAYFWLQGESGVFADAYITSLTALAGEIDTAARAILTDQTDPVLTFTYQLDIAESAHWYVEAQRTSPLIRIVGPMYSIEVAGQRGVNYDETHRSAPGYRYYGAQAAVAWFCHFILKRPWRPLQLSYNARGELRCEVDGSDLILVYDVPHQGWLEFDVPVVGRVAGSDRMQRGFYLFNSGGTEKPLRAVSIEGRNKVRLVGASPAAGDVLRIGFKDPTVTTPASVSVNLRDRQGDVIRFDDGGGVGVHNWALAQEHTLTTGELS